MVNSRLGSFAAAPGCLGCKTRHSRRHSFSRSYGVVLPSSLTGVLSLALGFSPRLPVSVCGTGTGELARGFSRQHGIDPFGTVFSLPVTAQDLCVADLPTTLPTRLDRLFRQPAVSTLLRHPIAQTLTRWYRNLNLLSIAYAFRPRLRSRLTLSGRTLLRNP